MSRHKKKNRFLSQIRENPTLEEFLNSLEDVSVQDYQKQFLGEFPSEKKKIYIFARESCVAHGYARKMQIQRKDFRIIETPTDLYGVGDVVVHRITTWWDNPRADEINAVIIEMEKRGRVKVFDVEY